MKRVLVIGAGITGASIAFHLSLRGDVEVTVVNAAEPGKAATHASFAWINARDKSPRHYHDLNRRSLDMWPRFARRLGVEAGLTWGGELRWSATGRGARELEARVGELQSWGYPVRLLTPEQVSQLEPGLDTGAIVNGSFSDADGHVETSVVVETALKRAQAAGATVRWGLKVERLAVSTVDRASGVKGAVTPVGLIEADVVVLAAGTGVTALAESAGVEVPQKPTSGVTVLTHPLPPVFSTVCAVHSPRDLPLKVNFRQLPDGRVMVHGGNHDGSLGDRSTADAELVLHTAAKYLPAIRGAPLAEVRKAMRPMPADGKPVIGFFEAVPNLYAAVMHSGVTLAPLVGEFAATEVCDGARIDLLLPYRPERFKQNR